MSDTQKKPAKKAAKKAAKKTPKADPQTTGAADEGVGRPAQTPAKGDKATRTREQGVGVEKNHPANKLIPGKAIIRRRTEEPYSGVVYGVAVKGDKSVLVFDVMQKRPVEVLLLEGKNLDPTADNRLIFVQGAVSNDLMTAEGAKAKFAVQPDGTAVYNARGFDDVAGQKFDLLDIAALIESRKK